MCSLCRIQNEFAVRSQIAVSFAEELSSRNPFNELNILQPVTKLDALSRCLCGLHLKLRYILFGEKKLRETALV